MKKMHLLMVVVTVLVLLYSVSFAESRDNYVDFNGEWYELQSNDQYLYIDLGNDCVGIALYIGKDEKIDLNKSVQGKQVTDILTCAFASDDSFLGNFHGKSYVIDGKKYVCKTNISEVILPDSLRTIGYMAFIDNNITHVEIPTGIQSVGYHSFAGNPISELPYIPDSASMSAPFSSSSVSTITLDNRYTAVPDYFLTFSAGNKLILHDGITSIGSEAFYHCNIKEVVLPETLKTIGDIAFRECDSLISILIPDGVSYLGEGAFLDCQRMKSANLPAELTELQNEVFKNCAKLSKVQLKSKIRVIGREAFAGCVSLQSIALPDSLEIIENYAFSGCKTLKAISIPTHVTSIGIEAFSGCKALTKVSLPAGVEVISSDAFEGCSKSLVFEVINGTYAAQWAADRGYKVKLIKPVENIALSENTLVLDVGKKAVIKANIEPADATNKKVEWISTDDSVATVKNGTVTAKSTGSCDVSCRAIDGSGVLEMCHVEVIHMVASLKASHKSVSLACGESLCIEVSVVPSDASNPALSWVSTDDGVCSVNENGTITAVSAGNCEIICSTVDGSNKNVKIKVKVSAP